MVRPKPEIKPQCEHDSESEDSIKFEDYKSLSRSFSSIKQRLKTLAKDMSTPVSKNKKKDGQDNFPSPLTLKIFKSADGRWKSDTPPEQKIVLRISNGRSSSSTPKLKIKPIRKCKTDGPTKIKISLRNPSKPADAGTPKSRFVPEGWVSFDQVQSKLANVDPPLGDVEIIKEKKPDTKEKIGVLKIKTKPPANTKETNITKEKSEDFKIKMSTNPTPSPSISPFLTKPKISLRTDLFEVKEEKPSPFTPTQPENSILKSKLMLGRRNLMDTIENLKENKVTEHSNKLVVLNPVMEDLSDVIEVGMKGSDSFSDIIELDDSPPDNSDDIIEIGEKLVDDLSDIIEVEPLAQLFNTKIPEAGGKVQESCYCCPTMECRYKPVVQAPTKPKESAPRPVSTELPVDPMSQLDQAIASISSDTLRTTVQPSSKPTEKIANKPGGIGFMELDQAIASIAELQNAFLNLQGADLETPGSPYFLYNNEDRLDTEVYEETSPGTPNQGEENIQPAGQK